MDKEKRATNSRRNQGHLNLIPNHLCNVQCVAKRYLTRPESKSTKNEPFLDRMSLRPTRIGAMASGLMISDEEEPGTKRRGQG